MTFDAARGVEVLLPYFWQQEGGLNPHYKRTKMWFATLGEHLPHTLLFQDNLGIVTLLGMRFAGVSGLGASLGRLRANTVIFGRPREVKDEYFVEEIRSTIDGLREFADFQPIRHDTTLEDEGEHRTTVTLRAAEAIEWEAEGFTYRIRSSVRWHAVPGRSFVIDDSRPHLSTSRPDGATPADHLAAQWAVRALLVLIHGRKLQWRSHHVVDDQFPQWMMGGGDYGKHEVPLLFSGTVGQHAEASDEPHSSPILPFTLADVRADGMKKWVELYAEQSFARAIQPAVEVLNGASPFIEPQLMMVASSLERLGAYRYGDGRRRTMAEQIERCLDDCGLDLPAVGSNHAVAQMIAKANNDLKHPDRPNYPDRDLLVAATRLSKLIIRGQLCELLDLPAEARESLLGSSAGRDAVGALAHAGLTLAEDGSVTRGGMPAIE